MSEVAKIWFITGSSKRSYEVNRMSMVAKIGLYLALLLIGVCIKCWKLQDLV